MARRRYSDEERAQALTALRANGGNAGKTARQLGIPPTTLCQWKRGERHPEAAQLSNGKTRDMAAALEAVAWQILEALPEKVPAAPLAQAATAMGIAIDKARLLRELPTEITEDKAATGRSHALRALYVEVTTARAALVADGDDRPQPLPAGQAPHGETARLPGPDLP